MGAITETAKLSTNRSFLSTHNFSDISKAQHWKQANRKETEIPKSKNKLEKPVKKLNQ